MWRITFCSTRFFYTHSSFNAKLGNVMKKVLGEKSKRKKIFSDMGVLPSAEMFSKGSSEGKYSGNSRRVSVLNKLFMKYITDLLATGEYSSDFVGRGIEITRVQISPDYNALNVFWVTKDTTDSDNVENLLKKNAGFLRHELSSLRVVGVVPIIQFVKDKHHFQVMELDSRLTKADFGEDYVPTRIETRLKTELELIRPLSSDIKSQLQELDSEPTDYELEEEPLPPMPQNVLGLNHSDILNRVKRGMKKSQALHRLNDDVELQQSTNENPIEFASNKERREAFRQFLEKRELLRSRARKSQKNYIPDLEYLEEEFKNNQDMWMSNFEDFENEQDFIIEDQDEKSRDC